MVYRAIEKPKPPENPKVRLSRFKRDHVRIIEVLRWLRRHNGMAHIDTNDFFRHMAFRGMVDPFEGMIGGIERPLSSTNKTRAVFNRVKTLMLDLGLAEKAPSKKADRINHKLIMTHDGADTLRDWENEDARGIYVP
jgi:hypothetical protein